MSKTLTVTHKLRRNTAATWSSENPVLANGEPGYDTTNKILKIGDGTTPWNTLPAIGGSSIDDEEKIQTISSKYIRITSLNPGIYRLTYNGTRYIYDKGSSSTHSHQVLYSSSKQPLLYVSTGGVSTSGWEWHYFFEDNAKACIVVGAMTSSDGSCETYALDNLVKASRTSTAGKVLLSSSTAGQGQWAAMDMTPTSASTAPITSGGVYTALQNERPKVLWENPNKTSAFSAQTITLPSNNYDYFIVDFVPDGNYNNIICSSVKINVGEGGIAVLVAGEQGLQVGNGYINTRVITASTQTSITFSNSWWMGVQADTGHCIPVRVTGYRVAT